MSVSTLACEFVSYARFVGGRECGEPVTHAYDGTPLCRDHYIYESRAYAVCNKCHASRWEEVRVFEREHTCSAGDQGYDCMHFEDATYCTCEEESRVILCVQCEELARPSHHEEMCEGCLEESVAEDRFLYETYCSQ